MMPAPLRARGLLRQLGAKNAGGRRAEDVRSFSSSTGPAQCAEISPGPVERDFAHHAKHLARLNHGSFGACPEPVLRRQDELRRSWLAEPDSWYFGGRLDRDLRSAALSAVPALTRAELGDGQVCLVENATVATVAVAKRWAGLARPGDVLVLLSVAYVACVNILREYVEAAGAELQVLQVPFPCRSHAEVAGRIEEQLRALRARGKRIRFAFLDHVSSQPALLLPAKQLVVLCRLYGAADLEVLVDGAHSVGSCEFDVRDIGADWFLSNLHKWGFAPSTSTVLYASSPELMLSTRHPITSWDWGKGLAKEARFPGTRDFSALLATPAAMEYLSRWRSEAGETSQEFCHRRVVESARELAEAWGTAEALAPEELVATQAMVKLPPDLRVDDVPGKPGRGVRAVLRERFGVEAAVGGFGELGGFVRLSYGVYNTRSDIEKLRDAVLVILDEQNRGIE